MTMTLSLVITAQPDSHFPIYNKEFFMSLKRFAAALLAAAAIICGQGAAQAQPVSFGIISTESSVNLKKAWDPFINAMKEKTGLDVRAYFASDYAGIIEAMRFGKVDFAWIGNKGAIEMVDRSGGEVFAQVVGKDGTHGYYSYLIVNKKSRYQTVDEVLKDAKNLVFSNGDPNSTSGYLVPGYYIFGQRGLDPKKIFKRTLNASHEANAMAVANGKADVATFNSEAMGRLTITQPAKAQELRVVWKSPLIPGDPLVWRKNLDQATKDKIKSFVLSYGKGANAEAEMKVLNSLQWSGFIPSSDRQLDSVRVLEYFRQKSKIQDSDMPADEKKAKIAEIDAAMKKLSK